MIIHFGDNSTQSFSRYYEDKKLTYVHVMSSKYPGLTSPEIEDVVQDSFIKVWQQLDQQKFDRYQSLMNFHFILIRNGCLNRIQRIKTVRRRQRRYAEWLLPDVTYENNAAETKELRGKLENAILNLPPVRLQVFILSYLYKKNRREISGLMRLAPETIKAHIKWALRDLRDRLTEKRPLKEASTTEPKTPPIPVGLDSYSHPDIFCPIPSIMCFDLSGKKASC